MDDKPNKGMPEKIIEATIRYIGEFGVQNITTRKIAAYADVNPALVNYYFGSQDELIDKAISLSMRRYFRDVFSQVGKTPERTDSVLKDFFRFALKDAIEAPNIIRSYLYQALLTGNCEGRFVEELSRFLSENEGALTAGIARETDEGKKLALVHMMSSILFICILPDFFIKYGKVDFHDQDARTRYVADLVDHYSRSQMAV